MIGGLAIGLVIILGALMVGFCLYEVTWKSRRLSRDLVELRRLGAQLTDLQEQLTRSHVTATRIRGDR